MIGDQPIYNTKDTIKLGSIKAFELLCEGADFFGMRRLQIEKFHWGDIQIVTDFKKIGHGRECLIVFNAVDISLAETPFAIRSCTNLLENASLHMLVSPPCVILYLIKNLKYSI